jgi:FAD synthase
VPSSLRHVIVGKNVLMVDDDGDGGGGGEEGAAGATEAPEMPVFMEGPVVRGFGRGSRLVGFPTANLPTERYAATLLPDLPVGVYYGWAMVAPARTTPHAVRCGRRTGTRCTRWR